MFLLTVDESQAPRPGSPASQAMMPAWLAYNQKLIDGGHWISGGSLQQSDVTTVVRKNGQAPPTVTDGPFAETKEQVAGYYLVRADDLDAALELATAIPLPNCVVEVRPLAFRPTPDPHGRVGRARPGACAPGARRVDRHLR